MNAACFSKKTDALSDVMFSQTEKKSFFTYYNDLLENEDNILLTSDFILYIEHLMTDYTLRYMEKRYMINMYSELLKNIIIKHEEKFGLSELNRDAYELNEKYLYTCLYLLDSNTILPVDIANDISNEIFLIKEHRGENSSYIFKHNEDYSQYIPRGHYNDDIELKCYFISMMYFQRMRYKTEVAYADPRIEMRAALMMSAVLNESDIDLQFNKFYNIISFYLQVSDDILCRSIRDRIPFEINDENIADNKLINTAADILESHDQSKIISDIVDDNEKKPVFTGIMGQRYIFDSEVFTNLVYNRVGDYTGKNPKTTFSFGGGYRIFPRGLDLFSVLGSDEAKRIIYDEGDADYIGYSDNVIMMSRMLDELTMQCFYNNMLNQYKIIINSSEFSFINGKTKKQKELNTMLSSWASLRHDVILYAKQSYTAKITSAKPLPMENNKRIIAEPYTDFYAQAALDVNKLLTMLHNVTGDVIFMNIQNDMTALIDLYVKISVLTLNQDYYSNTDELKYSINNLNNSLKMLIKDKKEKIDNTLIIADIHTDPNSNTVLEEASGYIMEMHVQMKNQLYRGGLLSYYEFKHPMNDRLTDEKWRDIINMGTEIYYSPWQRGLFEDNSRISEE